MNVESTDYTQIAKENGCLMGLDGNSYMCLGKDYPIDVAGFGETQEEACHSWYRQYTNAAWKETAKAYDIVEELLKDISND